MAIHPAVRSNSFKPTTPDERHGSLRRKCRTLAVVSGVLLLGLSPLRVLGDELGKPLERAVPTEPLPDHFRAPTTLREGSWLLGVGAGWEHLRNLNGEPPETYSSFEGSGLYPDLAWGITDRLTVNLTQFGAAYRFGERDEVEFIPAARFGIQVDLSPSLGQAVVFPLRFTADARFWLAQDTATTLGIALTTRLGHRGEADCELFPSNCEARDYVFDQWEVSAGAGLIHTFARRLTVAPSVSLSTFTAEGWVGQPWFKLFGRLNRGVIADPFLRFHIVSWFALDLDASISIRPSDASFASFFGGGMTFNW